MSTLSPEWWMNTCGPMDKMILTVLGMVAEMELGFIRERKRAGIDAAKAKGSIAADPQPSTISASGKEGRRHGDRSRAASCRLSSHAEGRCSAGGLAKPPHGLGIVLLRAKAAIPLRAQNRLHRLEQAFIEAPTKRREGRKAPNPSGGFALQAPGGLT
jgi:hypothetical protein